MDKIYIYDCDICGEEWSTYIEDDDPCHDNICPLCGMPVTQMLKDVYIEEGFFASIKMLYKRTLGYLMKGQNE